MSYSYNLVDVVKIAFANARPKIQIPGFIDGRDSHYESVARAFINYRIECAQKGDILKFSEGSDVKQLFIELRGVIQGFARTFATMSEEDRSRLSEVDSRVVGVSKVRVITAEKSSISELIKALEGIITEGVEAMAVGIGSASASAVAMPMSADRPEGGEPGLIASIKGGSPVLDEGEARVSATASIVLASTVVAAPAPVPVVAEVDDGVTRRRRSSVVSPEVPPAPTHARAEELVARSRAVARKLDRFADDAAVESASTGGSIVAAVAAVGGVAAATALTESAHPRKKLTFNAVPTVHFPCEEYSLASHKILLEASNLYFLLQSAKKLLSAHKALIIKLQGHIAKLYFIEEKCKATPPELHEAKDYLDMKEEFFQDLLFYIEYKVFSNNNFVKDRLALGLHTFLLKILAVGRQVKIFDDLPENLAPTLLWRYLVDPAPSSTKIKPWREYCFQALAALVLGSPKDYPMSPPVHHSSFPIEDKEACSVLAKVYSYFVKDDAAKSAAIASADYSGPPPLDEALYFELLNIEKAKLMDPLVWRTLKQVKAERKAAEEAGGAASAGAGR